MTSKLMAAIQVTTCNITYGAGALWRPHNRPRSLLAIKRLPVCLSTCWHHV